MKEVIKLDLAYMQAKPVVTRQWKRLRMALVGCGGTGSWLAPSLARLASVLTEAGRDVELTFIDPDRVEAKNIPRQNFCAAELGANKAEALALRYSAAWGVEVAAVPHGIERYTAFRPGAADLVLLVGCVDNAAARLSILADLTALNEAKPHSPAAPAAWWLDCGNASESGQVLLGSAARVADLRGAFTGAGLCMALPSPALQRPELLRALPEEAPDATERLSCAELALLNAQSLMVNQAVAAVAADYVMRLVMTGGLRRFATYFDLPSGSQRSLYTTEEAVATAVRSKPAIFSRQPRAKRARKSA